MGVGGCAAHYTEGWRAPDVYIFFPARGAGTGTDAEDNMDQRCGECVVSWFASVKQTSSSHTLHLSPYRATQKRQEVSGNPLAAPDASELLDVDTEGWRAPDPDVYICGSVLPSMREERAGGPRIRMYITL